jgi:hypothetical protein
MAETEHYSSKATISGSNVQYNRVVFVLPLLGSRDTVTRSGVAAAAGACWRSTHHHQQQLASAFTGDQRVWPRSPESRDASNSNNRVPAVDLEGERARLTCVQGLAGSPHGHATGLMKRT